MRLLSERDIERLLDSESAIAAAEEAYRRHSAGAMPAPGRLDLLRHDPIGGALVLGGHSFDHRFAVKTNVHAYAGDATLSRSAGSALVLWDGVACVPLAFMATTAFNDHRTAAGFAAAARLLAPKDTHTLAVFGAGKIAPATVLYLAAVRKFSRILIVGRDQDRAHALAAGLGVRPELAGAIVAVESDAGRAANEADVIAAVSTAEQPVFPGEAVRPGTFVVLGGANRPNTREADDAFIRRARIFTDHLDGCLARAGDLVIPLASGALYRDQIFGEIGTVLATGVVPPAPEGTDVTVFKSIGIAGQDVVLAGLIYDRAVRDGVGLEFDPRDGPHTAGAAVP
ncbi:MAG: ornithine cyclodeaminase family protein [Rhodoplanes sp.]|uniref:ornithine cyclodeaminase family protein n=1 Tax=Rhodoplanes sp. TaxID=1968906 RepID=UPI0017B4EF2E|nr:hypothetical protein [Rhodoplanes sp.]NVO17254.1 ornithine cyclodeaminase family protein [Rhodoplanes sp.]